MLFRRLSLFAIASVLLLSVGTASAGDRWLHVRVDEDGRQGDRVRVQVPMTLIEAMLPLIDTEEFHDGVVHLGDQELDKQDVAKILRAVGEAEDGEYVRVDSRDGEVRVAKQDGTLHIDVFEVDSWGDQDKSVTVRIPMAVVKAMISGEGDALDILAGIQALDDHGRIDLVSVEEDDSVVRVWIDDKQADL